MEGASSTEIRRRAGTGVASFVVVVLVNGWDLLRLVEGSDEGSGRRTKGGDASTDERTGRSLHGRHNVAKWKITSRFAVVADPQ